MREIEPQIRAMHRVKCRFAVRASGKSYVFRVADERVSEDAAQSKMRDDVTGHIPRETKTLGAAPLGFVQNLKHSRNVIITGGFSAAQECENSRRDCAIQTH